MWFDRLTQQPCAALPDRVAPGRYQWQGEEPVCLNSHTGIEPGQLLVNDGSERGQLDDSRISFDPVPRWVESDRALFDDAITTLSEQLKKDQQLGTDKTALPSPLLPAAVVSAESDLLPLERTLQQVLDQGHLHQISRNPRLDIRYNTTVLPLARARRLAPDALVHLASHSECWQRQTLSGIVPKKVKARISEDDFQIYENRVYARLLDKLDRHLAARIQTVQQLNSTLNQALEFYNSQGVHYRLAERICTLWGQTFDEDRTLDTLALLQDTLNALTAMQQALRPLRRSGLYLQVPRQARAGDTLHRTNILNHDAHYRHVANLWDLLHRSGQSRRRSPAAQYLHNQALAAHYSRWVGLVLQQALDSKPPFQPDSLTLPWAAEQLVLSSDRHDWQLSLQREDDSQTELLHIIPWYGFTPPPDNIQLAGNTIVVWPSIEGLPMDSAAGGRTGWLPLSPLDLYCVERAGWLLEQLKVKHLLQDYAQPIERIPRAPLAIARELESQNYLTVSGQPPALKLLCPPESATLATLIESLKTHNAVQQAQQTTRQADALTELVQCPICKTRETRFEPSGEGFLIRCNSCRTDRYLVQDTYQRYFENRLDSPDNSFRTTGRWAIRVEL